MILQAEGIGELQGDVPAVVDRQGGDLPFQVSVSVLVEDHIEVGTLLWIKSEFYIGYDLINS